MFVIRVTEIKHVLQSNKTCDEKRGKGQTAVGETLILSYSAETETLK